MSNALKFTAAGGEVCIQFSQPTDDIVRVAVQDNGPGIPLAERAHLFTENAQFSPRPTGHEESHGVGLNVARQLAEHMGGTVGADFPSTGGSVFWCDLPAA